MLLKYTIYNIRYIKPIDVELLAGIAEKFDLVITVEDGCVTGGLFGAVSEYMSNLDNPLKVRCLGISDEYVQQDTQASQRSAYGLDKAGIKAKILGEYSKISAKVLENKK